jgi:hypothetical protein
LRAFYGFTVLWRRWSGAKAVAFFGAGVLAIVLLAFGLVFWSSIIWTEERFYLNRFLFLIAIPAIVLYFMAQVMILGPLLGRWWRLPFLILMAAVPVGLFAYGIWNFDEVWNSEDADRGWNLVIYFAGPALFLYLVTRCFFWKIVDWLGAVISRDREPRHRTG